MLYTFSQLVVQRKYTVAATEDTLKSIARSSFFIFFHAYNGTALGCVLRRSFGRFYYRVLVCAPALVSSYLSLLIEKPARRQALAFYMLNLASEIVYRMAVTKGYFRPIRHGETILFAASLGAWYHLIKTEGFGRGDPVSGAVRVLIGNDEAPKSLKTVAPKTVVTKSDKASKLLASLVAQMTAYIDQIGHKWLPVLKGKHPTCPHGQHDTCLSYILSPIPSRFLLGYGIQVILRLSSRPQRLILNPAKSIMDALRARQSLRFGLFLASLVSVGRLSSCSLRRYSNSNQEAWHGAVSGFLAGLSMWWAPKSSLSMYVMWKAIEQYYLSAHRRGQVRLFEFTILTIYSASAATILYAFALEPHFVRPSYMKFLDTISDHRLHQINRMVLDVFGTGSSIGYEDYFPDLHPKYMSNQFKELIFNWMIQPYE